MSYEIRKDFIPGLPQDGYRTGVGAYEGVVAHSTATPEATDEAETKFYKRAWKTQKAFVHFFVDWDSITQHADTRYKAWGAGNGNPRYVHVELCETADDAKFKESYKRYVWLIAKILKERNLGVADGITLVSHDWISKHLGGTTHSDPIAYLKSHGVEWSQFVHDVHCEYTGQTSSTPVQAKNPGIIATVRVLVDDLNIRSGAGTKYKSIGKANKGDLYNVIAHTKGWHRIILANGDNREAWVYGNDGKYLELVK